MKATESYSIFFLRYGTMCKVGDVGHLEAVILDGLLASEPDPDQALLARLTQALNKWGQSTEEGRDAWDRASNDFNFGDLSDVVDTPASYHSLQPYLEEAGIQSLSIRISEAYQPYDRVLMTADLDDDE